MIISAKWHPLLAVSNMITASKTGPHPGYFNVSFNLTSGGLTALILARIITIWVSLEFFISRGHLIRIASSKEMNLPHMAEESPS